MKKKFLIAILFSQFIFYNCSDEASITNCEKDKNEIEIIAEQLGRFIEENHPDMAIIYFYDNQKNEWISQGGCNGYKLEPPFIIVCSEYYYLKNLVKFGNNGGLELFFNF